MASGIFQDARKWVIKNSKNLGLTRNIGSQCFKVPRLFFFNFTMHPSPFQGLVLACQVGQAWGVSSETGFVGLLILCSLLKLLCVGLVVCIGFSG